jgi:hypothetical protein
MNHVWLHSPFTGDRLLVHLALADFASDEGVCWPKQETLARKARCSRRLVASMISEMQVTGWLVVEVAGGGRGRASRYRLETPHRVHSIGDPNTVHSATDTVHSATETSRDTSYKNRQEPSSTDADFDAFWSAYPRKVAKQHARRVFMSLMRRRDPPTVAQLVAAVTAYSTTFSDIHYCAHPATWLRQERWTDHDTATSPTTRVEVEQRIRDAESFGAGYAHAGHDETQLLTDLAHRPDDERDAAVTIFRELTRGRRR